MGTLCRAAKSSVVKGETGSDILGADMDSIRDRNNGGCYSNIRVTEHVQHGHEWEVSDSSDPNFEHHQWVDSAVAGAMGGICYGAGSTGVGNHVEGRISYIRD